MSSAPFVSREMLLLMFLTLTHGLLPHTVGKVFLMSSILPAIGRLIDLSCWLSGFMEKEDKESSKTPCGNAASS